MIKERPILFNAPMVRAVLDGRKTQTRRICKQAEVEEGDELFSCPYGKPGDRLWVREAWGIANCWLTYDEPTDPPRCIAYRADHAARCFDPEYDVNTDDWGWDAMKWKPSIHMPRWASRITLEITDVRVERLQEISRGDALAEGCPFANMSEGPDPRKWYTDLWTEINGASSWDANPWVWVIEFKRCDNFGNDKK